MKTLSSPLASIRPACGRNNKGQEYGEGSWPRGSEDPPNTTRPRDANSGRSHMANTRPGWEPA